MSQNPNWKRRRLASRALKVLERHGAKAPALSAYELTLKPAAMAFIGSHDRLRSLETARGAELKEGKAAVDVLVKKINAWAAQLAAYGGIPDFDRSAYADRPEVADDVIADGESLLDVAVKHKEAFPDSLPFAELLIADLTAALETARTEWLGAEGIRSEYQLLVYENRQNAERLDSLLIGFRQTVAAEIGRKHPDSHALRAAKVDRSMPEDSEAQEAVAVPAPQDPPPHDMDDPQDVVNG